MSDSSAPQSSNSQGRPPGWQDVNWGAQRQSPPHQAPQQPSLPPPVDNANALTRFIGGSPLSVLFRLLVLSLVVGALLVWLDIQPREIFYALERFIRRVWYMGFDAIREIASYVIAGAVIVVPLWLLIRLFSARK